MARSLTRREPVIRGLADEFLIRPEPWTRDALCQQTDPDAFFPDDGMNAWAAKQVCAACDVRVECLEYALRTRQVHGVWGGMGPVMRRRLLRERDGVAGE